MGRQHLREMSVESPLSSICILLPIYVFRKPMSLLSSAFKSSSTFALVVFTTITCLLPLLPPSHHLGVSAIKLDGSPDSFIQYPPWVPCANGSLSFEFKTKAPNVLLLYFNNGKFAYYELKLYAGRAVLRVQGDDEVRPSQVKAGHSLNDGQWHLVLIENDGASTYLSVDNGRKKDTSRSRKRGGGRGRGRHHKGIASSTGRSYRASGSVTSPSNDTFLVIGGLSQEWKQRGRDLALASVRNEHPFPMSVRNLTYRNCGGQLFSPAIVDSKGTLHRNDDLCKSSNPCLNGGVCLTTDQGLLCNCANTDFMGEHCQFSKCL